MFGVSPRLPYTGVPINCGLNQTEGALAEGSRCNRRGKMASKGQRRGSRSPRKDHRAPNTTAGPRPDFPPPLDTIAWLLQDPARREGLRRQLIDGKAGDLEPLLWKLAYSGPRESDGRRMRVITLEQWEQEIAAKIAEERRRATEPEGGKAQ